MKAVTGELPPPGDAWAVSDSQIPRSASTTRAGRVVVVASVVEDGAASSPPLPPSGYSQPKSPGVTARRAPGSYRRAGRAAPFEDIVLRPYPVGGRRASGAHSRSNKS
jgi:hypothetical protein